MAEEDSPGIAQYVRDLEPAHYSLKIDSFSFLVEILEKTGAESYDSDVFEAGGAKWKLSLYPNGDNGRNGRGYISMYLTIQDTNTMPKGWEIYGDYKFFVLDQIRDQYLIFQDAGKKMRRFRETNKECGIPRLLSRKIFDNVDRGFLIRDKCVFGVEIVVFKHSGRGECLALPEVPSNGVYTGKVTNFSTLPDKAHPCPVFTMGNCKWQLNIYPRGSGIDKGKSVSVFLHLVDAENIRGAYAEYKLSIKDQKKDKHLELKANHFFPAISSDWGWYDFVSLKDIEDASKGFLVQDSLIVEVEFFRISISKCFA